MRKKNAKNAHQVLYYHHHLILLRLFGFPRIYLEIINVANKRIQTH